MKLNLAVRYRIAMRIHMYTCVYEQEILADFNLAVAQAD